MLPNPLLLVPAVLAIVSVGAQYGITGIYDNLPLESSGAGSGNDVSVDTDCSNKDDGLYAIGGCSPQFLTCSGGISRIMDCPAELIYDPRIVACEYSYNVPECSGAPVEVTTSSAAADDVTTVNPYAPVEEETTTGAAPADDVTTVNPYAPAEEETTTEAAPADDDVTTVNPYAPVEEETTTGAAPADDVTTVNPYAPAEEETTTEAAPANDEPVTRSSSTEISCAGKSDGYYSFGECSDHYTACSNGYLIPMQCPAKLAFDEARVLCDYPAAVPECQNGSGNDESEEGSASGETSTEASAEVPYGNGAGYEEETTTAAQDPYAPVPEETTVAEDVPETTTAQQAYVPVPEETTTTQNPYAPVPEETTVAEDVPETTTSQDSYAPIPEETTTAEDVPETTTTQGSYVPVPEETTTTQNPYAPVPEETTTAEDVPEITTTQGSYAPVPEVTTTAEDVPETTTTQGSYVPVPETPVPVETTTAADVPVTEPTTGTSGYGAPTTAIPNCTSGASALKPCSQTYLNCVNGHYEVFTCQTGLFFSSEQGECTSSDQIAECHQQTAPY